MKRVKIKSRPIPFVSPEIRQLKRTRDNWHKRAIKTKDRLHWNTYRFFCQAGQLGNYICRNGNVYPIWEVLNRCLPRKDQPLSTTEDHFSQANKFNQFVHLCRPICGRQGQKLSLKNTTFTPSIKNQTVVQ